MKALLTIFQLKDCPNKAAGKPVSQERNTHFIEMLISAKL